VVDTDFTVTGSWASAHARFTLVVAISSPLATVVAAPAVVTLALTITVPVGVRYTVATVAGVRAVAAVAFVVTWAAESRAVLASPEGVTETV